MHSAPSLLDDSLLRGSFICPGRNELSQKTMRVNASITLRNDEQKVCFTVDDSEDPFPQQHYHIRVDIVGSFHSCQNLNQ